MSMKEYPAKLTTGYYRVRDCAASWRTKGRR